MTNVYNYFLGSSSGTALGTTSPYVDSNGNLIIAGMPPIPFISIQGTLPMLTPSSAATQAVVTLNPGSPALNTDYSFNLTQPLFTTPGSTTNLDSKSTLPVYIPYNTGAYTSAPTATQVCNDIRVLLASYGYFDFVLTGSSTVIITATVANPILTGAAATGSQLTVTQTTTGVQSVGYYQNMVDIGLNVPQVGIIGAPVSGHTYSTCTFTCNVQGVPLAAMKTQNNVTYNVFIDEADSNFSAFALRWNALHYNQAPVGDDTYAASGVATTDSGAATIYTIASYVAGTFYPGQWVQVSGLVISGATPTSYFNGVLQVLEVPSTTTITLNIPWLTSAVYGSGGTVQPLAPVI